MVLTIKMSDETSELLRQTFGDNVSRAVVEALASEGYRSGKLSRYEVQQLLGFDNRWDTEEWLGSRGLHPQYTMADLEADRRTIEDVLGPVKL